MITTKMEQRISCLSFTCSDNDCQVFFTMFLRSLSSCGSLATINVRYGHKKSCNESYFSQWSPSMAYWLGFMHADESVFWNKRSRNYRVSLCLKCFEYEHVMKFSNARIISSKLKYIQR